MIKSKCVYYDFRKIFEMGSHNRIYIEPDKVEKYKKAAIHISNGYKGPLWISSIHFAPKPWRRVIFEEVQDLVEDGKSSQDCFIQLTREVQNVWLVTATPFPKKRISVYANNQLLGFKRMQLFPNDESFEVVCESFEQIKKKLYLMNPDSVRRKTITDKIQVNEVVYSFTYTVIIVILIIIIIYSHNYYFIIEKVSIEFDCYQLEIYFYRAVERIKKNSVLYEAWIKKCTDSNPNDNNDDLLLRETISVVSESKIVKEFCRSVDINHMNIHLYPVQKLNNLMITFISAKKRYYKSQLREALLVESATKNSVDISEFLLSRQDLPIQVALSKCNQKFPFDNNFPFRGMSSSLFGPSLKNYNIPPIQHVIYGEENIHNYFLHHCSNYSGLQTFNRQMSFNHQTARSNLNEINKNITALNNDITYFSTYNSETLNSNNNSVEDIKNINKHSKIAQLIKYIKSEAPNKKIVLFAMSTSLINLAGK